MTKQLHTIPETAAILGVSRATVYHLIACGDLGSCDVAPSASKRPKTRVSDEHIERFIKARTRKERK